MTRRLAPYLVIAATSLIAAVVFLVARTVGPPASPERAGGESAREAASGPAPARGSRPTIVVTYPVLGSIVKELVGDEAQVVVPMPNGQDPHEWEPSARDMEAIMKADLIVQNGLGLEGGMEKALAQAREAGGRFFTASDHITVRRLGGAEEMPAGDASPGGDNDAAAQAPEATGALDPHFWTDPVMMRDVVGALASRLQSDFGIDLTARAADLERRLEALNQEIAAEVNRIPVDNRVLVTGHTSLGYFARRFGFRIAGAIVPGLTTQAGVSAAGLADLGTLIRQNHVKAIFTELGTPRAVADALGRDAGVKVIEVPTHYLPPDGSYFTCMRHLVRLIVEGLA